MTYEQGFRDAVEQVAHRICMHCQQGLRLEDQEMLAPDGSRTVYMVHPQSGCRCTASDIRALTPGYWRNTLLSPESMAAKFHESYRRLAPKFGYRTKEDRQTAQTQVNRYREALKHIAVHSKESDTVDVALKALSEGERFPLWEPVVWVREESNNRLLTIAVCAEILSRVRPEQA